jgi:uncharacterized membrane protein YgcG
MKKFTSCLITAIATSFIALNCIAQTPINLKHAPANVVIDGNLEEWGDSLSYFNDATRLFYTLANDKDNLYLVVKTNDPATQAKILSSGLELSVDAKDRKKSTYSVTFPIQEQYGQSIEGGDGDKKLEASMTKLRRIKADGFKDVENDLITLQNTYGFKIALSYDEKGFLEYEEVIPLKLFHADEFMGKEWAFNIKVNGPQKSPKADGDDDDDTHNSQTGGGGRGGRGGGGGGGGRGGRGGGGGRGGQGRAGGDDSSSGGGASKSADFWGKFVLAK